MSSSGANIEINVSEQATDQQTPSSGWFELGYNKPDSLSYNVTKEMTDELKNGFYSGDYIGASELGGSIPFNYTQGRYDKFLKAILRSDFDGGTPNTLKALNDGTGTDTQFAIEKIFKDIGQFHLFKGMKVATMELTFTAGEKIGGTMTFQGTDFEQSVTQESTSVTPAMAAIVQSGGTGIGDVYMDGAIPLGCVTGVNLTINANLSGEACLGRLTPKNWKQNMISVSGTFRVSFDNDAMLAKARMQQYIALAWEHEENGSIETWTLPKLSVTGYPESGDNQNQNFLELSFEALYDDAEETAIKIERS